MLHNTQSGQGFADRSELAASFRRMGLHVPAEVVQALLDKHGDGEARKLRPLLQGRAPKILRDVALVAFGRTRTAAAAHCTSRLRLTASLPTARSSARPSTEGPLPPFPPERRCPRSTPRPRALHVGTLEGTCADPPG